jgi:hypothetical protein
LALRAVFRLGLGLELESKNLYPIILDIFHYTGEARVRENRDFFLKKSWISLKNKRNNIAERN